jgi:hypothetical protein
MGESYDQKDAAGFIRILGLPSRSQAQIRAQKSRTGNAKGPLNPEKTEKPAEVVR